MDSETSGSMYWWIGEGGKRWDWVQTDGPSRSEAICCIAMMSSVFPSWLVNDVVQVLQTYDVLYQQYQLCFRKVEVLVS